MTLAVLAGIALLFVVAPSLLALHRGYRARRWVAEVTPVLTCAQLREDSPPRVAVAARTSAQEIIQAPVSGEDCVCFWTFYRRGTYDESDNRDTWYDERRDMVGRIVIEDDTGSAVITPELAERTLTHGHDRVVTTAHERTSAPPGGADSWVEETQVWLVRPGVPLFVIGTVAAGGTPTLDRSSDPGGEGVAARSRAEVLDHLAARIARSAAGAGATAFAGLVLFSLGTGLILIHR
ncbi:hypothetical protein [Actinomadura sp. DC4]|uniref:hypothetical protein n=1 Tax=Actinomadura sp. DC4 TaxID=3055069 RepID=UPI0025B0A9F2|nr:hypothetical protein [Actinomadura sp. DC4]MDN3354103.1 hypothetical protein [Actinomadura sp. DC4]